MRRSLLLIPILAVLAGAARGGSQDQPPAVDVVFVVDASRSMDKNDPEGLRNTLMSMTADFMQGRGGDRLAIVQFAGWNETQNEKVVLFPLTEIPQPGKGADFEKAFSAAVAKAKIFGSASDINVAFELGVAEVQKQRGTTKNGLWVIVLTDAALSAPEPKQVREDYKRKAAELFKLTPDDEATDAQLNAAALDIFTKQVLPKFVGVKITAVTLAKKAPPATSPIQMLVGKDGKVGVLTADPLKTLIIPMLEGSQLYPKNKGGFYGYAKAGGASTKLPVHIYEGSNGTRAVIFSRGGKVNVKVTGPDAAKAEAVGTGPYKVVHFRGVGAGDYTIDIDAEGGSQIESVIYTDLPYAADIRMTTPTEIAAGDDVKIDIALLQDGKPVKDPGLVKSLKSTVKIKSAQGETTKPVTFTGDSKATFVYSTDAGAPAGEIEFTVELSGAQETFVAKPQTFKVVTATVVEASFEKAEILVDEAGGFTVKGAKGTPPKDLLTEILIKKSGVDYKAKLTWKDGGWTGTVPTDSIGEYEIVPEKKGSYLLKAGKNPKLKVGGRVFEATLSANEVFVKQGVTVTVKVADGGKAESAKDLVKEVKIGSQTVSLTYKDGAWTGEVDTSKEGTLDLEVTSEKKFEIKASGKLTIKPRAFQVLDKDGKPVEKLMYAVKYIEKGKYEVELTLKLDVGQGEVGTVESAGESKEKDVAIVLGDGKPVSVPPTATTQKVMAILSIETDAAIGEQVGTLTLTAKVAGMDWKKSIPVEVQFTDKAMKLFMKYLPFIIGGLLLFLIILFLLLLGKWKEQQVRAFLNNNLDTKYLMKSMGGGRSATGTEQSPGAAGFKLSGMKFTANAVTFKGLKPDVRVFHMDKPVTGPVTLKHGDVLSVEVGSKKQHYVYFEKEPTPEELKKALDGLIESDEIFISEE